MRVGWRDGAASVSWNEGLWSGQNCWTGKSEGVRAIAANNDVCVVSLAGGEPEPGSFEVDVFNLVAELDIDTQSTGFVKENIHVIGAMGETSSSQHPLLGCRELRNDTRAKGNEHTSMVRHKVPGSG